MSNPTRLPRRLCQERRGAPLAVPLGVCLALAGCAHPALRPAQTQVAYRTVSTPATEHYEVPEQENANVPVQIANVPPEYPAAMIARRLPHVAVRAKIVVDANGEVGEVRIEPAAAGAESTADFDAAVRTAVVQWRYVPLRFQQWENVLDQQGNVIDARLVKDETKPFSLDYEFDFDLRDGKPVVVGNRAAVQ